MPLVTTDDVLQLAVDAAAATQELSNLALFAPAAIAAGTLADEYSTACEAALRANDVREQPAACLCQTAARVVDRGISLQMSPRASPSPIRSA